ncbi:MAG: TonB-dependent receptor [Dysgonamonadaceae bacterium]
MKYIYILLLAIISTPFYTKAAEIAATAGTTTTLKGKILDNQTGEVLIGVNIYLPDLKRGTTTDMNGQYTLEGIPSIKTTVEVTYIGHQSIVQVVDLTKNHTIDFKMLESNASLGEVVVTGFTGNSLLRKTPAPLTVITPQQLKQESSSNIIDAIAKQPGISQVTTGSGISKPVIRGLGYNRVLVVNNGVRQEGQQWGDEHGIEIDAQTVNSVEILKGPASLMYGSDGIAGVINFLPEPTLPLGKIQSNILSEYQTNNGLLHYSVNNAGNLNNNTWNVRYSEKYAHAYSNKYDGYVYNSGFQEKALTGDFGINRNWGYSRLNLSMYHLIPGIVEGDRDETTGQFVKPVNINGEEGEEIATSKDFKSYKHGMPYQQIHHYKATLENNILLGQGSLKAIIGYQQNRRQEYEDIVNPEEYGLYLQLHTVNYDFRYIFPELNGVKLTSGVNGMFQKNLNKGSEFLIPDYNLFDAGAFVIGSKQYGNLDLSAGLRYDTRSTLGKALTDDSQVKFIDFTRRFNGLSGSLGATYQIDNAWSTKLNFSRGFRAPNISELASNGAHEGTLHYELGNKELKAESSWQADWGLSYSSKIISMDVSLFANRINNYIFAHKLTDSKGEEITTDGLMTFEYAAGNARIMGGEISIDLHPVERLHFQNTFSYVNSIQLHQSDSTKYLPMTPAPRLTSDLKYDIIRHGRTLDNTYVAIGLETDLKQNNIFSAYATETATPSYTLLNASLGTDFLHRGKRVASLFLTANNITNKAYQNHLSRLRYADVNQVTGREGVFNMGRNFGIKLDIPINF